MHPICDCQKKEILSQEKSASHNKHQHIKRIVSNLIALKRHTEIINHELSFAHNMSSQTLRFKIVCNLLKLPVECTVF